MMLAYATVADVAAGFRELTEEERNTCSKLLEEAALIIDSYKPRAPIENKSIVSCRMVRRAIGDTDEISQVPIGATQGTVSALGYSQSWTMSNGSTGELYLNKTEKRLLGIGNTIGSYSPVQEFSPSTEGHSHA